MERHKGRHHKAEFIMQYFQYLLLPYASTSKSVDQYNPLMRVSAVLS